MPDTPATTTALRQQSVNRLENNSQLGRQGWVAIAAITAGMALFLLPAIGRKSLWRDEGFSVSTVLRPWSSLFRLIYEHESNAALHSTLLKAWSVLGSSEAILRVPSALAALAAVSAVAVLATKLANRNVAIVAALLFACHGSVFAYGQQIRAYAFTMLFATLAGLALALDVRRPSRRALVGFVLASLALTYSNVMAVTLVLCMIASLFALPAGQRFWFRRGLAAAIVVVLTAPLALIISTHNEGGLHGIDVGTLWDVLMVLTGRSGLVGIVGVAILGIVALRATVRVFRRERAPFERWVHAFCLLWIVGPFLLAVVFAVTFRPVLSGRYMIISVPGICVYGAIGLVDLFSSYRASSVPGRAGRLAVAAAVAMASLAGVAVWLRGAEVEDWRGASSFLFANAREGDAVLFANDSVRLFFEYYRPGRGETSDTAPSPAFPPDPWGDYETGDHQYVSFGSDVVRDVALRADRVYVVVGRDHVNTGDVDATLEAELTMTHQLVDQREFNGDVEVLVFDRRP